MAPAEQCFIPISEISSYVQRWAIRARVTTKSPLRTFSKGGVSGGGKVFHVQLLDVHGGEIRASFFNEAADAHFDKLQVGKCYTLSRGSVRIANQQFNQCGHRYELSFDRQAQVEETADDEGIESFKLSLVDLRSVQSKALPSKVDLCGVVTAANSVYSFTSKEGRELVKREITIVDDTALSMGVTLWGERAKQDDSAFEGNPVICLKGVLVKEWNGGRSGSLTEGGALILKPTFAEARKMQEWWAQGGKGQTVTALSVVGGGGGSRAANAKHLDLAEVRRVSEQVLHQPELYSVVCRLALVQFSKKGESQPLIYEACQELREGKSLPCNRRVDSSGFCASCNRAGKTAPRFNLRCRFSDCADAAWLTTFHEAAEQAVGMSAKQAQELERSEGGREALEATIMSQYFGRPLQLTLRAKLDSYNGEARTNVSCVDARPVPRGERGRAMLREVREMLAAGLERSEMM